MGVSARDKFLYMHLSPSNFLQHGYLFFAAYDQFALILPLVHKESRTRVR